MALRRRRLAEFRRPLETNDIRGTDTRDLKDAIYHKWPKPKELALSGQDFQWAEAAIESCGERKCTFYAYKWSAKFIDRDDFVYIWSHGRLLVSLRRIGHGDGKIMCVTESSLPWIEVSIS